MRKQGGAVLDMKGRKQGAALDMAAGFSLQ